MHDQAVNFCFRFDGGAFYGFFSDLGLKRLTLVPEGEKIPARMAKAPKGGWDKTLHGLLSEYFSARPVSFDAVPLDMTAGTAFQQKVWKACYAIPYGKTASYGALARKIKHPGAARATGTALGVNPICLVIPCHRVVSSAGTLGGYYYGLSWKTRFLDLEREGLEKDSAR